jgi:linoleoyl-CoA desaturase
VFNEKGTDLWRNLLYTLSKITFERASPFYDELRNEVNNYFKTKGIRPTGDFRLYLKAFILLTSFVGIYFLLLWLTPGWISLGLSAVFGLVLGLIGFNVMHDSCHGSFSSKPWVNDLMGYSMNLLGSNKFIWIIKHNRIHHTYTNVDGVDDDIIKVPVLRHCESQPWKKVHKYQHIYAFLLYGISTILWVAFTDLQKYFTKSISGTPIREIPLHEHVIFWVTKIYYVAVFAVIPIWVVGFTPWLIGYLVANVVFGVTLSVVFQLAHAVQNTHFEDANARDLHVQKEWAAHQVETTSDFAMNSSVANWMLGGLNFQVIHHLFPNVSHVHYRKLQPIIQRVSKKHGITYNSYPTFPEAVRSHVLYLKMLGEKE